MTTDNHVTAAQAARATEVAGRQGDVLAIQLFPKAPMTDAIGFVLVNRGTSYEPFVVWTVNADRGFMTNGGYYERIADAHADYSERCARELTYTMERNS